MGPAELVSLIPDVAFAPDIAAFPDSVNILDNVSGDVRTPDKLIDGVNDTQDGRHMWLAPVLPGTVRARFTEEIHSDQNHQINREHAGETTSLHTPVILTV